MKNILIIGERRSGSSSLLKSISEGMKWRGSFEPNINGEVPIRSNIVTKLVISEYHTIDFYLNIASKYDKIILLSRRSSEKQKEALWALYNLIHKKRNPIDGWTEDKLPANLKELDSYKELSNQLVKDKTMLREISSILNEPIYFYEDIFYDGERIDGVKFDERYLDTNRKLRSKSKSMLI